MGDLKASQRDIVDTRLLGIEATRSHVDLYALGIGIIFAKIGVDGGGILIYLGDPFVDGMLRVKDRLICEHRAPLPTDIA